MASQNTQLQKFSPLLTFTVPESKRIDVRELGQLILVLLVSGVVITSVFVAPNASGQIAKLLLPLVQERRRQRRVTSRLARLKYLRIVKRGGQHILELTAKGKRIAKQHSIDHITIPIPKKWDNRWRIVVYDLPKRKNTERDILRNKLKRLGFREFQQSIWALPWPCREEINFTLELYNLQKYVGFWEVPDGLEFKRLLSIFNLEK